MNRPVSVRLTSPARADTQQARRASVMTSLATLALVTLLAANLAGSLVAPTLF